MQERRSSQERWVILRIDSHSPYALYASGRRLYRSNDQGTTWQTLPTLPTATYDFELDPRPGGARYILTQSGLLQKMVE